MKKNAGTFQPLEPMTFHEYCESRASFPRHSIIEEGEWLKNYDRFEARYFADYLSDMKALGYEPECGLDY